MVEAQDCTAAEHAQNPLMTPPCDCPRCAPPQLPADEESGTTTIWITSDGRPVRHAVDNMALGALGHQLLG